MRINEQRNAVRENPPPGTMSSKILELKFIQIWAPKLEEKYDFWYFAAVGAVGNEIDDDEGRNNRDWLDWFYVFSRVVVLFSVVYFYSTPLRLLAVVLLVCMFYL